MPATATPETVADILEHLKAACERGMREPTADLSPDQHAILLDLHIHDPLAAGVVLQHLREHARTLEGWTAAEARRLNFRIYVDGARAHARQQESIESAANVVRMTTQRQARLRRARTHDVTGTTDDGLTPEQMLETDAPILVAQGLLRQQRAGRLWFDEFYQRTMTDWQGDDNNTVLEPEPVVDRHVRRIQSWLLARDRRLGRMGLTTVNQIIHAVADYDVRNEPADWLRSLPWNETLAHSPDCLDTLMTRGFGAPDTAFNRHAGRCWMISMVARACNPGCKVDTMPVFIGPQGAQKSQALEVLGGKWYHAAASNIDSKDFLQELQGVLLFEIPELHSLTASRQGASRVKAIMSNRKDHFRMPYAMNVEVFPRTAVMAGTTNNRDWHSDETGGRRFWPIHCGRIDLDWLRAHRKALFAEALVYYEEGRAARAIEPGQRDARQALHVERGSWWNVPEDEQRTLIEAETFVSPIQDIIESHLAHELPRGGIWRGPQDGEPRPWDGSARPEADWGTLLTVLRIGVQWVGMTPEMLGRGSAHAKTISACMRALGWDVMRLGIAGRPRVFVRPFDSEARGDVAQNWNSQNVSELNGPNGHNGPNGQDRIDDDDIPF